MSCKRGEITGFDGGKMTEARKMSWRINKVEGDMSQECRLSTQLSKKNWTWNDNESVEKHISPWEWLKLKDNLKSSKLLNCYNLLPLNVKGHFKELSEKKISTHVKDIICTVEDVSKKGYSEFSYLYCSPSPLLNLCYSQTQQ